MDNRKKSIIEFAKSFRKEWKTNDPFEIAKRYNIQVMFRDSAISSFTAQTFKVEGYPVIISINSRYPEFARKVLCAHELGHALLHNEVVNYFAITSTNVTTDVELEANLFALALLMENEDELAIPLDKMENYLLKTIMDYNIKV